jgi:hypothetical protein
MDEYEHTQNKAAVYFHSVDTLQSFGEEIH